MGAAQGLQCCKLRGGDKQMVNSESIAVNNVQQPPPLKADPEVQKEASELPAAKEEPAPAPAGKGGKTGGDSELDQFELRIVRNGRPAGLDAAYVASAQKLYVWSVKADGLISEWNEANPSKKVYRGCMVLEINGESVGTMSDEDVRTAFLADDLTMLIQRG
mmetsp:Transcript_21821/g.40153  ORF Transcript_21821/g.40153 Transcript_21821/m.40153 type:complete len:162 (+) Transcript_21821:75-560(+)